MVKTKEKLVKIKEDPRIRKLRTHISCIWILSAFIAAVGAGTEKWLEYDNVTYHMVTDLTSTAGDYAYVGVHSGIYIFSIKTTRLTLQQQALAICRGYESVASRQNTLPVTVNGESCDPNCVSHFNVRCATFKALTNAGFVNLAFIVSGSALVLTGIMWLMMFGKAAQFLTLAWTGSGLACCFSVGYWMFVVWNNRAALDSTAFYPRWHTGFSVWIVLSGSGLCILAGITAFLAGQWDARTERKIKREAILKKEVETGGFELPDNMKNSLLYPGGSINMLSSVAPLGSPPMLLGHGSPSRTSPYARMGLPTPGDFKSFTSR